MEKQFEVAVGEPVPDNREQAKCPYTAGARKHAVNGTRIN